MARCSSCRTRPGPTRWRGREPDDDDALTPPCRLSIEPDTVSVAAARRSMMNATDGRIAASNCGFQCICFKPHRKAHALARTRTYTALRASAKIGSFGLGTVQRARVTIEIEASISEIGATIRPITQAMITAFRTWLDASDRANRIRANEIRTAPMATFASCEARIAATLFEGGDTPGQGSKEKLRTLSPTAINTIPPTNMKNPMAR